MRRRVFSALIATAIAAVAMLLTPSIVEVVDAASRCYLGGHLYNRNRQLTTGARISAECPKPYPIPNIHSPPFGNWGAWSRFGGRRDTTQFAGWKWKESKWQWNSCTTHIDHDPPQAGEYNMPRSDPRWWQETRVGTKRVNSAWLDRGGRGQTCRQRWDNRVYTFNNLTVVLYELDPWDRDEKVATLRHSTMRARLNCSSTWKCEGGTPWKRPRSVSPSSSKVTAEHYVFVSTTGR